MFRRRQPTRAGAGIRRPLLAGALLALALAAPASVIFSAGSPAASPEPVTLTNYLGTQVAALYTGAARLAGDMRLLYQITQLQELKLDRSAATPTDESGRVILCKESMAAAGSAKKSRT